MFSARREIDGYEQILTYEEEGGTATISLVWGTRRDGAATWREMAGVMHTWLGHFMSGNADHSKQPSHTWAGLP